MPVSHPKPNRSHTPLAPLLGDADSGTWPRRVCILGSTGSIGSQALEIIRAHAGQFEVVALSATGASDRSIEALMSQISEFSPRVVAVSDEQGGARIRELLAGVTVEVLIGADAATEAAAIDCDVVLNALAGAIGLRPSLAAIQAGRTLALANKESLVVGGPLLMAMAAPGQVVPVDSEHSALAQCLAAGKPEEVSRLVLTASGGAFRTFTPEQLADVTVEKALKHPNWEMGPLVTINSATMVNKGLELIEAHLLFGISYDCIDVVIHPQQLIHSMVEFVDGATIAQASPPDMHLPIALGLAWPRRLADVSPRIDWTTAHTWEFFPLDDARFTAVSLARAAGTAGGTHPAVFNAANEAAVAAFTGGSLKFTDIVPAIEAALAAHSGISDDHVTLQAVLEADAWARGYVTSTIAGA